MLGVGHHRFGKLACWGMEAAKIVQSSLVPVCCTVCKRRGEARLGRIDSQVARPIAAKYEGSSGVVPRGQHEPINIAIAHSHTRKVMRHTFNHDHMTFSHALLSKVFL